MLVIGTYEVLFLDSV